tara:strand:- start:58 stop:495 length:438 start_codon:yes stop_codon:yes gene_type:complete
MRGLYLMRYNTTDLKIFRVVDKKNNISCLEFCPDREHRWGKVGYKFGRTSNIEKRLEYFNKVKGIKYNLIKFFPCKKEKLREDMLKRYIYSDIGGLGSRNMGYGPRPEHINYNEVNLIWLLELLNEYANGKLIKDYKRYNNYKIQ